MAFVGAGHRVYYSGDTGLFPALRTIGERLGPFDITMIEIGQYDQAWPDWGLGPEQAVEAHRRARRRDATCALGSLRSGVARMDRNQMRLWRAAMRRGHLSATRAERRAHRGEASRALVARASLAHGSRVPDRRGPRRMRRSRPVHYSVFLASRRAGALERGSMGAQGRPRLSEQPCDDGRGGSSAVLNRPYRGPYLDGCTSRTWCSSGGRTTGAS